MKVQVDSTKCDAYGICVENAPEVFEIDDFGYASARGDGVVPEAARSAVEEAIAACPVAAIRILEP